MSMKKTVVTITMSLTEIADAGPDDLEQEIQDRAIRSLHRRGKYEISAFKAVNVDRDGDIRINVTLEEAPQLCNVRLIHVNAQRSGDATLEKPAKCTAGGIGHEGAHKFVIQGEELWVEYTADSLCCPCGTFLNADKHDNKFCPVHGTDLLKKGE